MVRAESRTGVGSGGEGGGGEGEVKGVGAMEVAAMEAAKVGARAAEGTGEMVRAVAARRRGGRRRRRHGRGEYVIQLMIVYACELFCGERTIPDNDFSDREIRRVQAELVTILHWPSQLVPPACVPTSTPFAHLPKTMCFRHWCHTSRATLWLG